LVNLEGARHIVFITDPKALKLPELSQLSALLGVTPAEARVSLALVQSGTYTDVAAGLNVSVDTVRSHVKAIYAKTRVNNKAALTRLVLSLSQAGA
jgi:DNA-binding CsgD family transcriptional regulator